MNPSIDKDEGKRSADWPIVEAICKQLNDRGATYALHGGFALSVWLPQRQGYKGDVDLTCPYDIKQYEKIRLALVFLPAHKTLNIPIERFFGSAIVRVTDGVTVDIMSYVSALAFEYLEVVQVTRPSGLVIPIVSGDTLVRIKQFAIRRNPKHQADLDALYEVGYDGNYTKRIINIYG